LSEFHLEYSLNMRKTPKINFNSSATERYWYLYWIGKIVYENRIFKVRYYFINTWRNDDQIRGYKNGTIEVKTLPIKSLFSLTPGIIYDSLEDNLITPSNYLERDKQQLSVFAVPNYRATTRPFPFLKSEYTPLNEDMDFEGLSYYTFNSENDYGKSIKVILPIHVLCHYIFFKSSNLIYLLINHDLSEFFYMNDKAILDLEGEKVGFVKYNNSVIKEQDAINLAPFLFMQNDKGIHALNSLSLRLKKFFIEYKDYESVIKLGKYLDTDWPFTKNMNLNIQGKEFTVNGESFFMGYRIINHNIKGNLLTVDRIRVLKTFSTSKVNDDSTKLSITVKNNSDRNLETSLENIVGNSTYNIQQNFIETDSVFNFEVPVDIISNNESDASYNMNLIPSEEDLSKGTLNTFNADPESEYIRQEFNSRFKLKIDRFDFVINAVSKLKTEFNIDANFNTLDKKMLTQHTYNFQDNKVMVIELNHEDHFYYLVEFDRGTLGFIHKTDFTSVIPLFLEIFIDNCLLELENLYKNEYLWTRIKKKKNEFLEEYQIVVRTSLTHQVDGFENADEAAIHMAEKIYNDRILKKVG